MNDLISRQAAIDAFDNQIWNNINIPICKEIRNAVKQTIRQLPFVQPERKKGAWVWVDGVRCSNCNHKLQTTGLPSFCPNCGAQMDERRDDG